jgi:hypothetical protein
MQTQCQLGDLVYEYNAPEDQNPTVRAVVATETLGGRYFTDWGSHASRRDITQSWPTMDAAFFEALDAKVAAGGTQSFTDCNGTDYTVICASLTYQRTTPGGDAYLGVVFKMMVVSSP